MVRKYVDIFRSKPANAIEERLQRKLDRIPGCNGTTYAAAVHQAIVYTHPFHDGNGRTARAVVNRILGTKVLRDSCSKDVAYHNATKTGSARPLTHLLDKRIREQSRKKPDVFGTKGRHRNTARAIYQPRPRIKR